ncbi:MAG: zinc-dependent metalloprotease family protein [Methylococcaceae bacterium]
MADEGQGYRVFMSEGTGGTMGHITTPEGTFNLESSGGSMYLVDTGKLSHLGFAGDTGITLAATAMTNNDLATKADNNLPLIAVTSPPIVNSSVKPVLDIMVLYTTQSYTAAYAKQRLAYLVTASNQAYTDSGINLTLRMVYAEPTTYTDKDVNGTALDNLANDSGIFVGTAEKRALYGADLVYLFRPLNAITQTTCGTTYLEMADGQTADKRFRHPDL